MKIKLFVILTIFLFSGFISPKPVTKTSGDPESIKKEISEVVKVIFKNLQGMNADALFLPYSDSPSFSFVTTDGSAVGLQEAKNHHVAWFSSLSSLKVTPSNENYVFLPNNIVICTWQGKFEMTMKTGMKVIINKFAITFIFSKTDNIWKVIYQHSSALPPVPETT
jgi:hypothetical protein